MSAPAPHPRRGALASLSRYPLALVHPVVLTFMTGAVFSYLSGDTFRAAYLLAIGLSLAWDHVHRRVPRPSAAVAEGGSGFPERGAVFSHDSAELRRATMRRLLIPAVIAAVVYSAIVGLFQRYSWPATILVAIPSSAMVLVAWRVSAGTHPAARAASAAGGGALALASGGGSALGLTSPVPQAAPRAPPYAHPAPA